MLVVVGQNPPPVSENGDANCTVCSCPRFQANVFDPNRCQKCQHPRSKHNEAIGDDDDEELARRLNSTI